MIDYGDRIPNNVDLAEDRRLQRALESWQPRFLQWWRELGPVDPYQNTDVYLRTAVDVGQEGWAHYDYVKMPEYRWGIFLASPVADRTVAFGDHQGEPVWQEVPGQYRNVLRRLIVVQGDTEPASVEQQRHLGNTAPSMYDLRNIFQVNVEEGRHLWAMVYLLHAYFGRDGREEADDLLERHSGDPDKPRILGAFNEPTPDWLSFFMFTYFTDRDGKYQLASLAESGFDPLARTCQFMLKEEAYHMFTGTTGIGRVVERTAELMKEHDTDDVRAHGGIDLATIQRYLNFHFTVSLDLFGREVSTNAAAYYTEGVKGRFQEEKRDDDHRLVEATYPVAELRSGSIEAVDQPALNALNATLQDDYIEDCMKGLTRWNTSLRKAGVETQLTLPHRAFHRQVGMFAGAHVSPSGQVVTAEEWEAHRRDWLPTDDDRAFLAEITKPVREPGKMANWIAPPSVGVHNKPVEWEYVKLT